MRPTCWIQIVRLAGVCIMGAHLAFPWQGEALQETDHLHTVCEIVQNPAEYEGQTVLVESTVVASEHATVLEGQRCGKGIYLSYSVGRSGAKWKALDDAIAAKSSGLDKRVLHIKVVGIYRNALQVYKRHIRQLEVTEVIEVEFEHSQKDTNGSASSPSAQTSLHESGHADRPSRH